MKKKPKHSSRKVTQEQVDAMNRQLISYVDYVYIVGADGRLAKVKKIVYDW